MGVKDMSETTFTVQDDKRTLVVERTFQAPRSKVWAAWTTPEIFVQWWGPRGWQTTVKHQEFTNGGSMLYGMKCEDPEQTDWYGQISWGKSTYSDIDAESSFVYTDIFCDENGVETPGMPAMKIKLEFIESDGVTHVVSTSHFDKPEDLEQVIAMGMEAGLKQTWDRLEELLQK
jgi:uncharacterized protein YndB with AHSA1/START domain